MRSYYRNNIRQFFLFLFISTILCYGQSDLPVDGHPATDQNSLWKLGIQLDTFRNFSFMEALDKTASLGLSWVEAYPGQKFSQEDSEIIFDHNLPETYRNIIRTRLRALGLNLINYGVVNLPDNEDSCRAVFDFARDMGIKTIVAEPETAALAMIDSLCQLYDIRVALYNHPKPSRYWNPDTMLKACEGRSPAIGICGDIGHWIRSTVNPLEAIRKLRGRLITFHLKDLMDIGRVDAKDVPVGKGLADIDLLLQELRSQKFAGVFSLEHENNWNDNLPYLRQSITNFNIMSGYFIPREWITMLDRQLSQFNYAPDSWEIKDDVLIAKGGGDIWSKQKFGNFILDLDFKIETGGNSGVFLRTGDVDEWLHTAIEVQIFDSYGKTAPDKHDCGAIFDCLEPEVNAVNKPGMWNRYTITCMDNKIYVVLNGRQVIDMDLNKWTMPHQNPDGTQNKFNNAYRDMPRTGNIGLQYHGDPVMFRNIKIRILPATEDRIQKN